MSAQGLAPSAPTKEFLYFNGRVVAIEQRGPGVTGNALKAFIPAAAAPVVTVTSPPTFQLPTLPTPGVPPQAPVTGSPTLSVPTPASTHTAGQPTSN